MTPLHYIAKAKDKQTLELPAEAQRLNLQAGDEIHIYVDWNDNSLLPAQEEEARFRELTAKLYAEADLTEREPIIYSDPEKAAVAEMIADKHHKMGMKI